jgi:penicillin amidase
MGLIKDFCGAVLLTILVLAAVYIFFWKPPTIPDIEVMKFDDGEVTIYQNHETGIPKIEATSKMCAYYGLGYVHARDRLHQMKVSRALAFGRTSALWGKYHLDIDLALNQLRINQRTYWQA